MILTYFSMSFLGCNVKSCLRDNFRFPSPIYTQFDPVMQLTIVLDEFEDEWLWPTFLKSFPGHNAKTCLRDNFWFPSPIYTKFHPVMHLTIALDEFEDEWPWPTLNVNYMPTPKILVGGGGGGEPQNPSGQLVSTLCNWRVLLRTWHIS